MNEHFLKGFFKQAAIYNVGEEEALELLKNAGSKMPGEIPFVSRLLGKRRVIGKKNMKGQGWRNPSTGRMEYPDSNMYNRPSDKTIVKGTAVGLGAAGVGAYALKKSKRKKDDSEKSE